MREQHIPKNKLPEVLAGIIYKCKRKDIPQDQVALLSIYKNVSNGI